MSKSPLNYLICIAFGVLLWVITAIFYGGTFSESLILAVSTPEEFLANFRIVLGIAAASSIINTLYWFYYGNISSVAGNLGKAKRVWWVSFIIQIIISVALLVILVVKNLSEGILTSDWIIIYVLLSIHTWIFFWLFTFLMSPRPVKNIPLFR